jgi:flagellin-like protein
MSRVDMNRVLIVSPVIGVILMVAITVILASSTKAIYLMKEAGLI